jgi:Amt family ammonium transporter
MPEGILTLAAAAPKIDTGNTAFMLLSAALVLLMTPGLAFFYGGMVRVKSVLNMLMMSFISIAIITILWTLYGFSIAFVDFAGGTAVHINAGAAALGVASSCSASGSAGRGRTSRTTCRSSRSAPVCCGSAGSASTPAPSSPPTASPAFAFVNTQVATAAALLGWLIVEWIRDGKPTLVGASSGAVAGLVAITPACGFIAPLGAILLGLVAGVGLRAGGQPEVPLRLRRLARRGRRPLRRRWIGSLLIGLFATAETAYDFTGAGGGLSGGTLGGSATATKKVDA